MNKISQKMIEIAKQLSSEGLTERAEQFIVVAEDLEQEIKTSQKPELKLKKLAQKEIVPIDKNELKQIFNKPLTQYKKYKD